ncbi:hypothetical protein VOLCADRAFT_93605 [Volvox carteri f. nagariensis]|uniref:Uncharacterized protein n=1 Tax=Volvox carteri f. nagariensis TaxID=3068 RepID=D8U2J8_VOLCA|nr:uncharacterized protein VOLCADRAFT_93605 [Volvox carteri f. nagariensis]EFJ46151.1 hypothetical protein VOLCADRAFT_93605 [Volvox carteri f. nagariensis]|eukprot:XP_002952901.1 hypothetical protein VOLCADRAFT_93605 [Volvox carteri f. nagariensis]
MPRVKTLVAATHISPRPWLRLAGIIGPMGKGWWRLNDYIVRVILNIPNNNNQNNPNNIVIQPPAAAQGVPTQVVEQLIQHQNFNAVFTNINAGREEALSRRYTDLEQNREASCPKAVKFMAAWIHDIGSKVYSAHSALKVIQATVTDIGPVVDILQQSIFIMDLLYASCDAGGRCHQYHLEVMQQYFNNNRHQAVSPTAEVKVDTD